MGKEFTVISILKDKGGETIGAKISDGSDTIKVKTEILQSAYLKGVKLQNAVLTRDGFVRSKSGSLPIELENNQVKNQENSVLTLYHGSNGGLKGKPSVNYGSSVCDFGAGFYTGSLEMQARNRICNNSNGYLYKIELNISDANVYTFSDDTLWALYVAINRGKLQDLKKYQKLVKLKNMLDSYDILIGLIADDKMARSYELFLEGSITDEALSNCLKEVKYGNQVVIKNQKYCGKRYFKIVKQEKVSKVNRTEALQWGIKEKQNLDKRVDEILKMYRRKGRYIDEILEDYK